MKWSNNSNKSDLAECLNTLGLRFKIKYKEIKINKQINLKYTLFKQHNIKYYSFYKL